MTEVTHRPGCWNKPRPAPDASYITQDGWCDSRAEGLPPLRVPRYVDVKSQFGTIDCQVGAHAPYPCCTGCCHNRKENPAS